MSRYSFISSISSVLSRWSKQPLKHRILQAIAAMCAAGALAGVLLAAYVFLAIAPNLPAIDALTDYRPKMPLRVFTADNVLIGEFGEERRDFVPIREMPEVMKKAIIAIEDSDFYEHGGVDFIGVVRAGLANLRSSRSQGASTITMQVARNFLLTKKKTYGRKLQEILLAYKIEGKLSKDQILELYMNQIYLGERAYGFGSAARIYFGKPIQNVTIAEAAMLAGLPKAPATANPVVNPKRARERQQYILKRMRELGYITEAQYAAATREKLSLQGEGYRFRTHAEYAAEAVRQTMYAQYKDEIYTSGMSVYTTLTKADQDAAYAAVRAGVMDYERRHGYRGPEDFIELPRDAEERQQAIDEILTRHPDSDDLRSAVVTAASPKLVRAELLSGDTIEMSGEGLRFAASALSTKTRAKNRIRPGSVIRVVKDGKGRWSITQLPEVSAALVALDAKNGGIRALVGGFDFGMSQFDHVSQAWRQPGSTIKPFIYSAALEKGFSPATEINDEPLSEDEAHSGTDKWNPSNDDGNYDGPVTMRTGLKKSKNLVSVRILRAITPAYAREYLTRFGFDAERHPENLTMTLGTGAVTPLQLAGAYAVFANGGARIAPWLIRKIVDAHGNVLSETQPASADDQAARVLDPRNAFIMDSMLRDVVRSGTGYLATQKLKRGDLAGKTGTTNDAVDGWFAGYGGDVVAVAWMGYDQPKSLGGREFGGTLALPMWIDYMRSALRGVPEARRAVPAGLVQNEGDWTYEEYLNGNAVTALDVDTGKSFWDRLFGSPPAVPKPDDQEKKRFEEIYHGG
nr:penicillin-binding protein 1A [Noviherbaspirillum massiliense]